YVFFFSSRRRHTRFSRDWSSDVCSSDLYLRNAAEHSLYIDGTVLYPGFELDELCAPLIALEQYVRATEDYAVLEEQGPGGAGRVIDGVGYLEKRLEEQRHPDRNLYWTFLSPTDDPVTHPYLT